MFFDFTVHSKFINSVKIGLMQYFYVWFSIWKIKV
jgi:hypothetical protein